jgi:hypothetical protein
MSDDATEESPYEDVRGYYWLCEEELHGEYYLGM